MSISGSVVLAQNTNSPYSRFGLGDLEKNGFGQNKGMGGISIGLRTPNQINPYNPASYTSQDTLSYIWDFGFYNSYRLVESAEGKTARNISNIDHIAMAFPISKKLYFSAGLLPYSSIGYNASYKNYVGFRYRFNSDFSGNGNMNQLYAGAAYSFLKSSLHIGFNVNYIFGKVNFSQRNYYENISRGGQATIDGGAAQYNSEIYYNAKGALFTMGIQYINSLSKDDKVIFGLTISPASNIEINYTEDVYRYYSYANSSNIIVDWKDSVSTTIVKDNFKMPLKLSLGVSYNWKDIWLVGVDYIFQDWAGTKFPGTAEESFKAINMVCLGAEFTPNPVSIRSYLARVHYRAGIFYNDSYIKMKGKSIPEYGYTLGIGLPFRNTKTTFNIAYEMNTRGTISNGLVKENFSRITFGLTLYDFWFYKRKYD